MGYKSKEIKGKFEYERTSDVTVKFTNKESNVVFNLKYNTKLNKFEAFSELYNTRWYICFGIKYERDTPKNMERFLRILENIDFNEARAKCFSYYDSNSEAIRW